MLQSMPISKSTDIDLNVHEDSSNLDNSGSTTKTSGHEIVDTSKVPNGNEPFEYEVNGANGLSILEHSSPEPKRKTTTYQERVSYVPNHDFTGNKSSVFESSPQPSIPNTFKYKSHPNAKTKALGSAKITEETSQEQNGDAQPVPTKQTPNNNNNKENTTPRWMPQVLDEKWNVQDLEDIKFTPSIPMNNNQSGGGGGIGPSPFQDLEIHTGDTMIHNSNVQSVETPGYRRARQEYEKQKGSDMLKSIFPAGPDETNTKDHSTSSTISSMFGTIQKRPEEIKQQMETIKEMRNTKNPESPLKLFGPKYNTYTRNQLAGLVENLKSNKNTPAQNQVAATPSPNSVLSKPPALNLNSRIVNTPPKNIKSFTKTGAYDEKSYLKNAENIFSNLKGKGFKANNNDGVRVVSQATNTSTPKKNITHGDPINFNTDSDYASFTSGYSSDGSDGKEAEQLKNYEVSSDDPQNYTSYTRESNFQSSGVELQRQVSSDGSYTYDEISELSEDATTEIRNINKNENISPETRAHLYSAKIVQNRIPLFEQENQGLRQNLNNKQLQEYITGDISMKSVPGKNGGLNAVKWKTRSQLKLNKGAIGGGGGGTGGTGGTGDPEKITRGTVEPGVDLPLEYDQMIFDPETQQWKSKNETTLNHGTFASIEDLVDNDNHVEITKQPSILKKASFRKSMVPLEVSFHEPNISVQSSISSISKSPIPMMGDITRVSQIQEDSFSESKKRLVSVITEILDLGNTIEPVPWNLVTEIELRNCYLNNVKDLNTLLPNLVSVDLSSNDIKYLTGIPKEIMTLNLSDNRIEDITPFSEYHELQRLTLDKNNLTRVTNLSKNIHLTTLSLASNQIMNIRGIEQLINLRSLNVSDNQLHGKINFKFFNFSNLIELDLSKNNLQEITGLQYLPLLRILNLDDNSLVKFDCKNLRLAKLLIRFNHIRKLDISKLPELRSLKFDGNQLETIEGLENLRGIENISCKSQYKSKVIEQIMKSIQDIRQLDVSGNRHFITFSTFPFLSNLTISAMNLTTIPSDFYLLFPNVQTLNLSFNTLKDISGLTNLKNLRKVYMVNNKLQLHNQIMKGLRGSRDKLKVLDVRLNPCTQTIYPFLFTPSESDDSIDLENADDIEAFFKHYQELDKSQIWATRDEEFLENLKYQDEIDTIETRDIFDCFMVMFFSKLMKLDGVLITDDRRNHLFNIFKELPQKID